MEEEAIQKHEVRKSMAPVELFPSGNLYVLGVLITKLLENVVAVLI